MISSFAAFRLTSLGILLSLATARAELPPEVYEVMQKASSEALTIEVVAVKSEGASITVSAKIVSVERSSSGLKAGDEIRINYEVVQHLEPIVGPSQPIIVKAGGRYLAYLAGTDPTEPFSLAARGKSLIDAPSIAPPR